MAFSFRELVEDYAIFLRRKGTLSEREANWLREADRTFAVEESTKPGVR